MMPHGSLASSSTAGTCCRAPMRLRAVLAWMTRRDGEAGAGLYVPALPVVPATRVGWTRTPWFAIVAYTLAIWTAFTSTPWPNESVYRSSPHHADGEGRMPGDSPGRFRPVGESIPNA